MEKIICIYEVPGVGKIELIHDARSNPQTSYYAKIKNFGDGMGSIYCTGHSNSEDELKIKVGDTVERILGINKSALEKELNPVLDSLARMSICSLKITRLDGFEVKD